MDRHLKEIPDQLFKHGRECLIPQKNPFQFGSISKAMRERGLETQY